MYNSAQIPELPLRLGDTKQEFQTYTVLSIERWEARNYTGPIILGETNTRKGVESNMNKTIFFVAFTVPGEKDIHNAGASKGKSPNTPNGVRVRIRTIVYPIREIDQYPEFSDACHDPTQKGTTKDLKCKAGRVRNPGSQCVRVRNPQQTAKINPAPGCRRHPCNNKQTRKKTTVTSNQAQRWNQGDERTRSMEIKKKKNQQDSEARKTRNHRHATRLLLPTRCTGTA